MFMTLRNVSFMWPYFIKNAVRIRTRHTIENITIYLISTSELQRPIYGFHRIPPPKMNERFKEYVASLCLRDITVLVFEITFY